MGVCYLITFTLPLNVTSCNLKVFGFRNIYKLSFWGPSLIIKASSQNIGWQVLTIRLDISLYIISILEFLWDSIAQLSFWSNWHLILYSLLKPGGGRRERTILKRFLLQVKMRLQLDLMPQSRSIMVQGIVG